MTSFALVACVQTCALPIGKQGSEWTFPRRVHAFGTFDPLVSTHPEDYGVRGQSGQSTLTPVFAVFVSCPGCSISGPWPSARGSTCHRPRTDAPTCTRPAAWTGHGDGSHARSEEHTSELQSLMRISYAV